MAKHIVFLIHGMGQHYNEDNGKDGWSKDGIAALRKGATSLKYRGTFKDDYIFVPISYSDVFDKYLEDYKDEVDKMMNSPSAQLITIVAKKNKLGAAFMKLVKQAPSNKNFVVSHFGDVLFYSTTHLGGKVRTHIRKTIIENIQKYPSLSWSIVAHSMGTRVCHDVLQGTFAKPEAYASYGKPFMFMAMGNVIELMHPHSTNSLYSNTRVYPSGTRRKGACLQYVNACHPLDPFTWLRHFDPPATWGDGQTDDRYHEPAIRRRHIIDWNTHAFSQYLSHPRVQELFFNGTHNFSRAYRVKEENVNRAVHAYEQKAEDYIGLKDKVEQLFVADDSDWLAYAKALVKYYKMIKAVP